MSKSRDYKFKDADMLLASKTVITSLSDNLADLSIARSNWTKTYVSELSSKTDGVIELFLGLNGEKDLRDITVKLCSIQAPALRDASFLKNQIELDFKKEAKSIIKRLGFDKHLRSAQKGDQKAFIRLLYMFKKGMTDELKEEIVSKGTNPRLIQRITMYANQLEEANISKESLKESTKNVSNEAISVFNEIYNEASEICRVASNFYQFDHLKKEQFTFSKVVDNMNAAKIIVEEKPEYS